MVVAAAPSAMEAFANAGRRAQRTGQPVEVSEQITETRRIVANPNETFTLTANRRAAAPDQTNALATPHWAEVTSNFLQAYDAVREVCVGFCVFPCAPPTPMWMVGCAA